MKKRPTYTDLAKLDAIKDEDIDYSDCPELDEAFFAQPLVEWPPKKNQITLRIDGDVM